MAVPRIVVAALIGAVAGALFELNGHAILGERWDLLEPVARPVFLLVGAVSTGVIAYRHHARKRRWAKHS
jgi:hypothetical protein